MTDLYNWIDTAGGPYLLVPEALLPLWRGVEGWSGSDDPDDLSDYAKACRITHWLGSVAIGQGAGLIFGGDVGPVTWITDGGGNGGYFVQALGIDDEAHIGLALASEDLANAFKAAPNDSEIFEVPPAGTLRLIDAADVGRDLMMPSLNLSPGTYVFSATWVETETFMMIVRKVAVLS